MEQGVVSGGDRRMMVAMYPEKKKDEVATLHRSHMNDQLNDDQ
jgi:hypothetical protein